MKLQRAFFVALAFVFVASFASAAFDASKVKNQAQVGGATTGPTVERLVLINADTDQDIAELTSGYVINTTALGTTHFNIRAETNPTPTGSVGFKLDALAVRTENTPPYAYAGDNGQGNYNSFTMTPGSHSLSVNAYTLSNRTGTQGPTKTVTFTVDGAQTTTTTTTNTSGGSTTPAPLAVTSFVIVNSDTNQDIMTIQDGAIIELATLGTDKITLRADTTTPLPASVKFKVNGTNYSTENLWPYTIPAGVSNDDYRPWNYTLDQDYAITATPYANTGAAGAPLSINFKIVLSSANAGTGGSHAMVSSIPAMGCLNATVTNSANSIDSANPGSITVSWPAVSGYPNYKVWRILNGNVYDSVENSGTAYTTNYVTPGTWSIRVAFLDPAAALNSNGNWGPESTITGLVVGLGLPTGNYTTCTPTLGQTTSVSLSAPSANANIISNSNFTVTAIGAPTSDQISSVKFYYVNEVGTNVLLGTDSTGPTFSLTNANLAGDRGAVCPVIYAEATLVSGSRIKTPRKYVIVTDTTASSPTAVCPGNGTANVEMSVTSPSQSGTYTAGQQFAVTADIIGTAPEKVVFYHQGGNVAQNLAAGLPAYTSTLIGTRTSAPYTLNYTVNTPGNIGSSQATDSIRAIAYYPDGRAIVSGIPFKVIPSAVQPQVSSLTVLKSDGSSATTMTSGMSVNVGSQANANTPLGQNISIKANPAGSPLPTPGSVKFTMSGPAGFTPYTYIDNTAPFSLFGDSGSTFTPWNQPIILGGYTVTATPYIQTGATGTAGTAMTLTFQLVNLDDATAPTVPSGVTTTYRSSSEIRLAWTASSDPETGVSYYKVTRNPGSTTTLGNVTTFPDTTVAAAGSYTYTVTAVNNVGQESGSSTGAVPPALSTSFALGNNVQTTASVTVKTAPDGGNLTPAQAAGAPGVIDQQYPIYYSGATYWRVNFTTGQDGWVNQSSLQLQPTADTLPPNNVTGLIVSNPTTTSLSLNWSATTDQGGGSVASYKVYRSTTQGGTYTYVPGSQTSGTSFTDSTLAATTTYWYKVTAVDNATPTANETSLTSATAASGTTSGAVSTTCTPGTVPVNNSTKRTVQLSSSFTTNPLKITICWPVVANRTINGSIKVERKTVDSSTWTTLTSTLPSSSTSYDDTGSVGGLSSGTMYEYRVSFNQVSTNPMQYEGSALDNNAKGYIATGINVPMDTYNGRVILVVDNTMATGTNGSAPSSGTLASSINTLINDLNGDRWLVYPLYVSRTDTPTNVRNLILAQYNADTTNTKAVYIIGHVPVPIIGNMNVDGHASDRGWSSDMMYGDVNETWTASCSSLNWAPVTQGTPIDTPPLTHRFCKTSATPELQVGRIDMYQMPAFGGTEASLLSGYLDRMHQMKTKAFTPTERAYIRNGLEGNPSNAYFEFWNGQDAWNDVTGLVGANNVTTLNDTPTSATALYQTLDGTSYEFVYLTSVNVNCNAMTDVSAANLASTNWGGVFTEAGISYTTEWSCQDSLLRSFLAKGRGANSVSALKRYIYWHPMAMGKTIGYSFLKSAQNTGSTYPPVGGFFPSDGSNVGDSTDYPGNAYMTLLGDPTMRMSYVTMPSTFTATGVAGGPVSFSWSAVSGAEGYNIYKIGANSITQVASMLSGTSYSGDTYAAGTKYMISAVDLKTSAGGGSYYNLSLGTITTTTGGGGGDTAAPTAPGSFQASNIQPTSVTLTWTASTGNPVGESITYKVMRSTSTNGTYAQVGSTITATPFTLTDSGLTAGSTYYYRVVASDLAGNTATSPSATTGLAVTLSDTQAPSAPAGLVSTSQTTSSIALSWTASTGNPVGESITYKVYRSTSSTGTYSQVGSNTTNTTLTDSGLAAGTMYYYKVSATDAAGNASAQNPSTGYGIATTAAADTQPPTVPTGLQVTSTTSATVALSWNASTDVGGSSVQGYIIYRSTSSTGTYTPVGNSGGTTYTDSGLSPSTAYYYKVSAIDNSSNGNESAQTAAVTGTTSASSGGGAGQVLGLMGVYAGPNNTEDVSPGANPYGVVDYFIDCAAGNDANSGTSMGAPWRTLDKFNTSGANTLQPGSRVFFKRGGTCYGTGIVGQYDGVLKVSQSGTSARNIEYKAYGTGNAPVISGTMPVTGWANYSGNIYRANVGTNLPIKYLYVGNTVQTLARTPNKDANGNTVFLTTDDMEGVAVGNTKLTDAAMPNSSTNNLAGGSVFYRHDNFTWITAPISAHSGTTLNLATSDSMCYIGHCSPSIYPAAGWGYMIENKLSLLDTAGEWYYDKATGYVYFWAPGNVNPATLTVEASVQQNGVVLFANIKYVKIKNLVFEKFTTSSTGAAIHLTDYSGAPGTTNNIIENVEVRNSYRGIRNQTEGTNMANGNKVLNSYIHDIYDIGLYTYGYGHLYQGNVIENVAMRPDLAADTDVWNHFYGAYTLGGNSDYVGNIMRNIGYIGFNHVQNGEISNNLVENISLKLNDGCAICADGAQGDMLVKRNVIRNAFGNLDGVPSNFIHASALSGGISTGDRSSIGGIFEENVIDNFGNGGVTLDNNFLSQGMIVRNNTMYTTQPGNSTGASGLKFMDQSVGIPHPPAGQPCVPNTVSCYVANFNHQVNGNNVYMMNANNHGMHLSYAINNGTTDTDYGTFWNNYFFSPFSSNTIRENRTWQGLRTGDLVSVVTGFTSPNGIPVFSSPTNSASNTANAHFTGEKGTITGSIVVETSGYRWWNVNFPSGADGWVHEYHIELADKTPAEWDAYENEPPAGQPHNFGPNYTIASPSNYPLLYVNDTGLPQSFNIGTGKCNKYKVALPSTLVLSTFGEPEVPQTCASMP